MAVATLMVSATSMCGVCAFRPAPILSFGSVLRCPLTWPLASVLRTFLYWSPQFLLSLFIWLPDPNLGRHPENPLPSPPHTPLLCISINVSICIWMYGRCLRWCSRPSASVSEPEKDCVHLCPLLAFQRATAVTSVKFRSLDKNLVTFHYQIL